MTREDPASPATTQPTPKSFSCVKADADERIETARRRPRSADLGAVIDEREGLLLIVEPPPIRAYPALTGSSERDYEESVTPPSAPAP